MPKQYKKKESKLHPRNKHQGRYDLEQLVQDCTELKEFVAKNKYGNDSIDFFNPEAVKTLNKALLINYYNVLDWDIPTGYLCPPIPGRADYIHHIADLLAEDNNGNIPSGNQIKCLDIGVGANCIYPIIGHCEYGWSFVGTDIDQTAIENAAKIIKANNNLSKTIALRWQENTQKIFSGVIEANECFEVSICNPPFHSSQEDAQAGTKRKLSNLKKKKIETIDLNFGGKEGELWTSGGEKRFITDMIHQSKNFGKQCCWFTTLVSKKENLNHIYKALNKSGVYADKTIEMGQGNKTSRIVAWTFLNDKERKEWLSKK